MREVRVAMIGAGVISHRHMTIYENIQKNAEKLGFTAKVVAVAEIDDKKLRAWGQQYGFSEEDLYLDFRSMLKRDDIDVIDINVHNNYHTPVTITCLKAGYDCYVEKPMAASFHDAKLISDCAKKLGRKLHVQLSSIMTPQSRLARDMVRNGDLGDIYYVNLESVSHRWRPGLDWRPGWASSPLTTDFYTREIAGHGKSIDIGVYLISQILFILGQPRLKSVNGFARNGVPVDPRLVENPLGFGVEDIADGFAKFENGIGFHYLSTTAANTQDYNKTFILGSKGGFDRIDTDTSGGRWARKPGQAPLRGEPELRYYGELNGRDVSIDLNCDSNGVTETRLDPKNLLYNDNQSMWLAYWLGILDDNTRYDTPSIAMDMLKFTDGIFLSEELGREVTAAEIEELSPSLYLSQQEINGKLVTYDITF